MNEQEITQVMQEYVDNQEMPGGALIVRKNDAIVYDGKWGYANLDTRTPVQDDTIYRMASMTKCVIGVAVMQLVEQGLMHLDDPVSRFIPAFRNLRVANDPLYQKYSPPNILFSFLFLRMDRLKTVAANREVTIRDLLSHASGLEQGVVGMVGMLKFRSRKDTLQQRVDRYTRFVLDFQPGTSTSYSPCASFDTLGYILELVSGVKVGEHLKKAVFEPLEMSDATFHPNAEQALRVAPIYKRRGKSLIDVTGTRSDVDFLICRGTEDDYVAGSGGLYCTVKDYEHLARMLCSEGVYNGRQFLKPETVRLMHTEAQQQHLEPEPGFTWGLSVKIRQDPERGRSPATAGTYGWSGAPGTHFFVSPADKLEAVFATSRSDLGGASSYISRKAEELVFGIWAEKLPIASLVESKSNNLGAFYQ